MSPVEIVERQLAAYNARDLEAFVATYRPDVRIYRPPAAEPAIEGHERMREVYRKRFASPGLRAEIVNRIALGDKVIDHERVHGIGAEPLEAVAVYEVREGLIGTVWFFYPGEPFPLPKG